MLSKKIGKKISENLFFYRLKKEAMGKKREENQNSGWITMQDINL